MRQVIAAILTVLAACAPANNGVGDGGLADMAPDDGAPEPRDATAAGSSALDAADEACAKFGPNAIPRGNRPGECCDRYVPVCWPDGDVPPIVAANYDQSCDADSDCVAVSVGDPCQGCVF